MAYFLLFYDTVENYIEKRAPHRALHLAHVNKYHKSGQIVMGGALAEPADQAVIVFRVDDASIVEEFAQNDPYVKEGLIKNWRVRPWTVVIGND